MSADSAVLRVPQMAQHPAPVHSATVAGKTVDAPGFGGASSPDDLAADELFDGICAPQRSQLSLEAIGELVRAHFRATQQAPENVWLRGSGGERVLRYLETFPGDDWQAKWLSSPLASAAFVDCPGLIDAEATQARRNQLTGGLTALFAFDVVRPAYEVILSMKVSGLWSKIGHLRDDPDADLLVVYPHGTHQSRAHASAMLGRLMLFTGKQIADLTGADLLAWRQLTLRHRSQSNGIEHLWSALASLDHGSVRGTFRESLRGGQKSITELVDRYPVRSKRVRNLLIAYLTRRRSSDLDYATVRSLTRILVSWFWCAIEEIEPGIDSLSISDATADAWRERARHKPVDGEQVPRENYIHELMAVRALYLDLQRWAHDEPEKWAVWACRSPITEQHTAGYAKWRKRKTSLVHQRTRQRAPVVTRLADAAERILVETRALHDAALAVTPGDTFTVGTERYQRIGDGRQDRHVRVVCLSTVGGRARDLVHDEEYAFWSFCIIETLRHTGVRIEELLELTQMDITQYEHDEGTVLLLRVNPSKTDRERIVVVPPELAAVFAQMMRRIRLAAGEPGQALPNVVAYDYGEAKALAPLPMIFQRTAGRGVKGQTRPMTRKFVRDALLRTSALADIRGTDGAALHFTQGRVKVAVCGR